MKMPLGDQSSRQQDDHSIISSDGTVQFTDIGSDAGNRGRSEGNFIQPPVTINVYGAGAVVTTGGSDTVPTAATTSSSTGVSGNSDSVISRLESQIAALSEKVEQLASQINSAQPQPRLQVDNGQWWRGCNDSPTHRITFSKRFESAPRVIASIFKADLDCNRNFRLDAYATDIDSEGFTVHADIWADTILFQCGVSWVAIGNAKE